MTDPTLPQGLSSLTQVVDRTSEGILLVSPEGDIRLANRAFRELTDSSLDALLGRKVWSLSELALGDQDRDKLEAAVRVGRPLRLDLTLRHGETEREFAFEIAALSSDISDGFSVLLKPKQMEGRRTDDVAGQARLAEVVMQLVESVVAVDDLDAFMSEVVDGLDRGLEPDFVYIVWQDDPGGSPKVRAHAGWREDVIAEIRLRPAREGQGSYTVLTNSTVVVPDLQEEVRFTPSAAATSHEVRSGMTVPLLRDKATVGVLGVHYKQPREFEPAEVRFLETVGRIISAADRGTRVQEALAGQQSQLEAVFENSADGIYLIRVTADGDYIYELANPAVRRITGLEFVGKRPEEVMPPAAARTVLSEIGRVVRTKQAEHAEILYELPGGTRRLSISRVPVLGPDEQVRWIVGVVRDVTAEHELHERLEVALRMEALDRLAGTIAVQLSSLLTGILGRASRLAHRVEGSTGQEIETIMEDARRAAQLVAQVSQLSGPGQPSGESTALDRLLDEVRPELERLLSPGTTLRWEVAEAIAVFGMSRETTHRLIVSLVENSSEAMPDGGVLSLTAERRSVDADRAEGLGLEPGDYVCLRVGDTGVGMDDGTRKHVFEPFFTTKEAGRGTGLTNVYRWVDAVGGAIRVESTPGEGTLVEVCLPLAGEDRAAPQPLAEARVGGSETILLVEDEDTVRKVTGRILERLGYTVFDACDAQEAMDFVSEKGDVLDLVVTDIVMPGLTGIELGKVLNRWRPELRILYISGYAGRDVGNDPIVPPEPFLPKPFTLEELSLAVRGTLDS